MGEAARARVLDGFTERDVMDAVKHLYRGALDAVIADPVAFIRAQTRLRPVPHAPEIRLHVADEATELWQKTEEELGAIGLPPPFWAFAWAGGQALARYVLDHPDGRAGPARARFRLGLRARARSRPRRPGAAGSTACDIDAFAVAAIGAQRRAPTASPSSGPSRGPRRRSTEGWDTVLAGDICYERDLAERVTDWLVRPRRPRRGGARSAIPGRSYLPRERLECARHLRGAGDPHPRGRGDQDAPASGASEGVHVGPTRKTALRSSVPRTPIAS